MSTVQTPTRLTEELAELFASQPTREQMLGFKPSPAVRERARELLERSNAGELSAEDERELDQYHQAELLMRLVKARLRAGEER